MEVPEPANEGYTTQLVDMRNLSRLIRSSIFKVRSWKLISQDDAKKEHWTSSSSYGSFFWIRCGSGSPDECCGFCSGRVRISDG